MAEDYTFAGIVDEVIDGDTVVITITIREAFHEKWTATRPFRLARCNAREKRDPTGGGMVAKRHLEQLLNDAGPKVTVTSIKVDPYTDGKYEAARYDAEVTLADGSNLTDILVRTGWAASWDGKSQPRPLPAWPRLNPSVG